MAWSSWEMQAGDPATFAFKLAFLQNPHDNDRSSPEENASWGSFAIWAQGENLCSHFELGERIDACHWYMVPLIEWLIENWDPLLHEERLKLSNAGTTAAQAMAKSRMPPLTLKETDEFEWLDSWATWWRRHSIRASRQGGMFPDLYIRRYRDQVEISTGAESLPGIPEDHYFLAPDRSYFVCPQQVSEALFTVLRAAIQELRRRMPDSARFVTLETSVELLENSERRNSRMAWLAGYGESLSDYLAISRQVDDALASVEQDVRDSLISFRRSTALVIDGSSYAKLLYGAISPDTTLDDVVNLTRELVGNYVFNASEWLDRLLLELDDSEVSKLAPGEQGSRLGEQACEILGTDSNTRVDIRAILEDLGILITDLELSDPHLRAISVFGPNQRPHIYCNTGFTNLKGGHKEPVNRFTLAHELCHLLLDKELGDELAVASGPWAPAAIEQRANAFAAAFLMPTWVLRDQVAALTAPLDTPNSILRIARNLDVSASSLVDRLLNLGELTFDDRIRLRYLC
ncbi:ImmA/IrrE family metallo-endopeptidase [Actinocrinis puniceicyclus]|uniref:ImmA/IrrE family metallo-endopeptidase n=1 Tax=Actinocrinis puniceicyclus TaxID=977794 RepID=A0A8J8BCS0_9ACTN|nr:ImmA/IrrE family metallo-endopeptidase [Actinocrinis puniceicyclus]MBS2965407.1 ImmA/IrrE family metallo-endopeptidase [Actinocrinis puniceicyclus]